MRFGKGARELQDAFDTRRLADRLSERARDHLNDEDRAFVQRMDMLFLATVDDTGQPTCSYKGGDPGFVRVLEPRTLAFPSYDGNGMFLSLGNLAESARLALLFIDFTAPRRLRVHGSATVSAEDPLLADYPEAQLVVRVAVTDVFPNCPRYVHRLEKVERSRFVPTEGVETPVPGWKSAAWAVDVLPKK